MSMNFCLNIRTEDKTEIQLIKLLANQFNLTLKEDKRYYSSVVSENKITQLLQKILSTIK